MNKSNRLCWETATEPAEHIEVRLVQNSYADNDNHGIYLISTKELEEALLESVKELDITANGLLDSISLFCPEQDLRHLTDKELIDAIHNQIL